MTSKSSFSKLLQQNIRQRIWNLAAAVVVFFFYFPVSMLVISSNNLNEEVIQNSLNPELALASAQNSIINAYVDLASPNSASVKLILLLMAMILGISGFSYLHDARKTDYYHGLPLKRSTHFMVSNLAGFLMLAVPYLIFSFIAAIITAANSGAVNWMPTVLSGALANLCFYALFQMTVVLAVIMTGNTVTAVLGSIVFFALGPSLVVLCQGYMSLFFKTFYDNSQLFEKPLQMSSPFTWALNFRIYDWPLRAAAAAILAILLYLLGNKLYQLRRSETAGQAMAFAATKAPIKILISVPCALWSAIVFYEIADRSLIWAVFGILVGVLLSCSVIEIIFHSDFRKLFAGKKSTIGALVTALAILCFFCFDLMGYDRFLPDAAKVESAGVHSYSIESTFQNDEDAVLEGRGDWKYLSFNAQNEYMAAAQNMHLLDVEGVRSLTSTCISQLGNDTRYDAADPDTMPCNILVCWHMKNGRDIYREYTPYFSDAAPALFALYDQPEYKIGIYPVLIKDRDSLAAVSYENASGPHALLGAGASSKDGSDLDKMQQLLDVYAKELLSLTAETRTHEYPLCGIQFRGQHFQSLLDELQADSSVDINYPMYCYYPVYPSFTNTIALLEEYGADLAGPLNADKISSIVISDCRGDFGESNAPIMTKQAVYDAPINIGADDLIITDKDEIKKLLESGDLVNNSISVTNQLLPIYNGVSVIACGNITTLDRQFRSEYYLSFDASRLPVFVKNHFGIDEEDIRIHTSR